MDGLDLLRRARREGEPALFLDGAAAGPLTDAERALRQWSFVAVAPSAALCIREGEAWRRDGSGAWERVPGEPWALVRDLLAEGEPVEGVPFPYGVAGLVSYDAGRLIEKLPSIAADDTGVPFVLLFRFDAVWGIPAQGAPILHARTPAHARALDDRLAQPVRAGSVRIGPVAPRSSPKEFEEMVVRAKERIRAGDVFQVNLSHRLECDLEGDPLDLYARLREVNPAPFSAYLQSGPLPWSEEGFHVLSSSPERLFCLERGRLEARPIAGTRRRDPDAAKDDALKAELRADPKEQAEHVMLVDLARNDLGRVARFGSVRVPDLLHVETYRTVHHLVSVVEAELAPGKDAVDALVAMFPGGTITGAPKVRSMEIIEEIEPVRRGVYTGSLGWFGPTGECDFSILIRTLLVEKGRVHLQVGAGIVEDSQPRAEYEETLAKARGLLLALGGP